MRCVASLFALAPALLVAATESFVNPVGITPYPITSGGTSGIKIAGRMTNARRLAAGLPPLKPKALHRGSRAASAPRAATSPSPAVPVRCNILITDTDSKSTLGYLGDSFNTFGEYGIKTSQADGLIVTFDASPDGPSTQLDFLAENPPSTTYPYLGGAVGYASDSDNFGAGNSNYAYLAGTRQTPPDSPAVVGDNTFSTASGIPVDYESAIWVYNPATAAITAQWVNTDGSHPNTFLLYNPSNQAILITGDADTLRNQFGDTFTPLAFTCGAPVIASQPPA